MMLYVNGDSHAAAAEAVNPHAWAQDDEFYWGLGKRPHPDNERVSFGCELANHLNAILECDAQAGGSNARIMRTTRQWLSQQPRSQERFVILQWSTWERQEWFHDNEWWQVNASGIDHVPSELQNRYREFVVNIDWDRATQQAHDDIWQFHLELKSNGVPHLMFNGNNHFASISDQKDWGNSYIQPYSPKHTYDYILKNNGFETVCPESWHFGAEAHCFWGNYLLKYMNNHNLR